MGSVSVTIYEIERADGYLFYTLTYYLDGKRKRETRKDPNAAYERAHAVAKDLAAGETAKAPLTRDDADELRFARKLLKKHDLDMTVDEAISQFVTIWRKTYKVATVEKVIDEFRQSPKVKESSASYRRDLHFRLDQFKKKFGSREIMSVGAEEVCKWIEARKPRLDRAAKSQSERTRFNWYNIVRTVWKYAERKSYLLEGQQALPAENPYNGKSGAWSIMKAQDLQNLISFYLNSDQDWYVPYIAVQAFGGLRVEEAKRLCWENIKVQHGQISHIVVTADQSKKNETRIVPMNPTLHEWLAYWVIDKKHTKGPIIQFKKADAILRKNAKRNGIPWKHNMIRHTFITHSMQLRPNSVALVASEAGTSVKMIKDHYREEPNLEEAIAWFTPLPTWQDRPEAVKKLEVSAEQLRTTMGWK